jgi:HNH endonuclease
MNSCDFKLKDETCIKPVFNKSDLCETHFKEFVKFNEVTKLIKPEFSSAELERINDYVKPEKREFTISDILRFQKKDFYGLRTGFQINIGEIGKKTYFKFSTTKEPQWNLFYSKMLHTIKIWMGFNSIFEIQPNPTQKRLRRQPKEKIEYKKTVWNDLVLFPIIGFEEEGYFITECGRVFSKKTGEFQEPTFSIETYKKVYLYKNREQKRYKVHRLVALTFIKNPNPEKYNYVNHINGDKLDNRKENLEWTNGHGNITHAYQTGLINSIKDQNFHDNVLKNWKKSTLISHLYISDKGELYNLRKNKIKSPIVSENGKFYTACEHNHFSLDVLVATEYCPQLSKKHKFVIHKDSDENNCHAENLYWSEKQIKCSIFVVDKDYEKFGPWINSKEFINYEFSKFGYIWSIKYKRLLTQKNFDNYFSCSLINDNNVKKQYQVSILIWCAYNDKPISYLKENKFEIDHIDRNTKNNKIENLRAVCRKENCKNRKNTVKIIMQNDKHEEVKKYECIEDCIKDNLELNFTYNGIYNSVYKGCFHKKHYFIKW